MAYLTQVGTTTTANTNLDTATLVHTQTNTTRIRKLWVNIFADQVKGTGDYIAHITIQRAGAGSFYESIKTTKAAGAGITSVYFGSIPITLNATDVMKVYLIGLATDNDGTADVIVDVDEEYINLDSSGNLGDKTGISLAATGLDAITATRPSGVASTFPQMLVQLWYRFFGKATLTSTQLKTYAANGTSVVTTQTVADDGTTQTQGESS